MATTPRKEDIAHIILEIFFEHFSSRPGRVLRINNFNSSWHSRGLASEDSKSRMEYAATQGWLEVQPKSYAFKLTDTGFAEY